MEYVLKTGYYKSPLGYNNVDWFVDEVIKLDNKMAFYFEKTNKDIILTEKDEEVCRKMVENLEIVFEISYFHMIWNGLAFVVT